MINRTHTKVTSGVFIPAELLSLARINEEDIEIEVDNKEIRIHSARTVREKVFTFDSPLWDCVGFVEKKGVSGKEHDRYIYNEEG